MFAACAHGKPAKPAANRVPLAVRADPHLVEMTAEATTTLLAAGDKNELGLRVRIVGKALPSAARPPLNLALVLDTSGSMEGDAIAAVKGSARELVGKLRDGDRVSVVAFHSRVEVLVPSVVVGATSRAQLVQAIGGIKASGTTDLAGGLAAGLGQVMQGMQPTAINRIVLLSDGVPNTAAQLPQTIASIHQYGISVTSLGMGVDYDTTLMTRIARDTGGAFHYVEKPTEVAAVFDDELTKMTTVVGRNLQLIVQPGPGVAVQPLPGLVATGDGRLVASIGDLAAGEVRDLMLPLTVQARGDGSTAELALATLAFDDVIGNTGHQQREAFVGVKASSDAAAVKAAVKIGLEVSRIRAAAAAATLQAIMLARTGQIDEARKQLGAAVGTVRGEATRLADPALEQLVRDLDQLVEDLAKIVPPQQVIGQRRPDAAVPAMAPVEVEPRLRRAEEEASRKLRGSK